MQRKQDRQTKYIFVGGGVASSLGKGTAAASVGALLEGCGYQVTLLKIDPYLNVDAGTMNPLEHGEVYVTADGGETDLDLGNYERFTAQKTNKNHIITTGKIYQQVLTKERSGDYLGRCVQVIPHITTAVKEAIQQGAGQADFVIIELGGTAGDIESNIYFEVARQMILENQKSNQICFIYLTLVPRISGANELKTKPTQHAVQRLRQMGIQPDILLCRCDTLLTQSLKEKISRFTHVPLPSIISAQDLKTSIYELPLSYDAQGLTQAILEKFELPLVAPNLTKWQKLMAQITASTTQVRIALVGKYTRSKDAYSSLFEALAHGGFTHNLQVEVVPIDSARLEDHPDMASIFKEIDGVVVPGGFGKRGSEGMIRAINYARHQKIPFLGICLGMQMMVVEFARHIGYTKANSREFDPTTPDPVVDLLDSQQGVEDKGATMRLGAYSAKVLGDSPFAQIYHRDHVEGRHRHRYEINQSYQKAYQRHGLEVGLMGTADQEQVIEGVYWADHPLGVGVQYHPELSSTPFAPEPLFSALIQAANHYQQKRCRSTQED